MENQNVTRLFADNPDRLAVALLLRYNGYIKWTGTASNTSVGTYQFVDQKLRSIPNLQNFDYSRSFQNLDQAVDAFIQAIRGIDLSSISWAA